MAAAALAMVRGLGGTTVTLCVCGSSDDGAPVGIGLSAPAMERVELSPVLLRTKRDGSREVVVDAQTLEAASGTSGEQLRELLQTARVNLGDAEARIVGVSSDQLGGCAYVYRLSLED
jgi:hypothetical protein